MAKFVDITTYDDSIRVDLVYATPHNFTGKAVYPAHARAFLREPVVRALSQAQSAFYELGYGLQVWDAYRPFSVQEIFWQCCPDERYIAKPVRSGNDLITGSRHSRGAAVDVTLIDLSTQQAVKMPTAFDDFEDAAHRHAVCLDPLARRHRELLHEIMQQHEFVALATEWWHFDWQYAEQFPLCDVDFAKLSLITIR